MIMLCAVGLTSCVTQQQYLAREQARETAYLKRIAADTLARPQQQIYLGQPYNIYNPYYAPIIRYGSHTRYTIPYRRRVIKRNPNGYRNYNHDNSRSSTNRIHRKKNTVRKYTKRN